MITECKCGTTVEAKLDVEKNEVICMNCKEVIPVTDFMKASLKSQGDIIRNAGKDSRIPEGGMKITCASQKCGKEFSAVLRKKDNEVYCPYCQTVASLSAYAKALLRENGVYEDAPKVLIAEGKMEEPKVQNEVE
jgi:hypothetical protein